MKILAICGSLQRKSGNLALLTAAAASAPPDAEVVMFDGLRDLPHFNPDLESSGAPESVIGWRRARFARRSAPPASSRACTFCGTRSVRTCLLYTSDAADE